MSTEFPLHSMQGLAPVVNQSAGLDNPRRNQPFSKVCRPTITLEPEMPHILQLSYAKRSQSRRSRTSPSLELVPSGRPAHRAAGRAKRTQFLKDHIDTTCCIAELCPGRLPVCARKNKANQRPCHSGPRSRISWPRENADSHAYIRNLNVQNKANVKPGNMRSSEFHTNRSVKTKPISQWVTWRYCATTPPLATTHRPLCDYTVYKCRQIENNPALSLI